MLKDQQTNARAAREATRWYALLSDPNPQIETEDLEAFSAWRADPQNKAAYEHVEDVSKAMRSLADDPDIRQATAEALARGPERKRASFRAPQLWTGGVIGAALAASVVIGFAATQALRAPSYSTGLGQSFSTRLEDGTRVQLNTDSAIRVRFAVGERRIELLRGQAFFDVAHNVARPFVVVAGDTRVRALGTRFEVRRNGDTVRVTLAQGSVEVTDEDAQKSVWRLVPGQALAIPKTAPRAAKPIAVDVQSATSWTTGNVTFQGMALADAVNELNRYSRSKIILGDGVPSDRLVTGVFPTGDNTDFIAAVSSVYGLSTARLPNGDEELRPKSSPAT